MTILSEDNIREITNTPVHVRCSVRHLVRRARKEETRLLNRLRSAQERGDYGAVRHLSSTYLKSRAAKIAAVVEAGEKRRRKGNSYAEGDGIISMAERLRVDEDPGEIVWLYPQYEAGGRRYRPIHSYSQIEQARQLMVAKLLRETAQIDHRQFATRGGRATACEAVMGALNQGCKFAVEVDIKSFFPSVDRSWLRSHLGLDGELVDSVLLSEDADIRPRKDNAVSYRFMCCPGPGSLLVDAQRGLPQGASSSSIVAEIVVSVLMAHIPNGVRIMNYADNFLLMGRTRRECEEALKTLIAVVQRCPAGRFELPPKRVRRCSDGFEFLGYRFWTVRGQAFAKPGKKNVEEFRKEIKRRLRRTLHGSIRAHNLVSYVISWRASFKLWWAGDGLVLMALRNIQNAFPELCSALKKAAERLRRNAVSAFETAFSGSYA